MKYKNKNTKIYSRKKFRLPGLFFIKNKKMIIIIAVFIIAIITVFFILKMINPIINRLCVDEAKNIATKISNNQATLIMQQYNYDDLMTLVKDEEKNIIMVQANTNNINAITSEIPVKILAEFEKNTNSEIQIYLGSLLGLKIFSGTGPKISAQIANTSKIETNLKSEFKAEGINQTLHRIYLEISLEVSILTPYNIIEDNVINQVLIAESIIVGKVPNSYYNLNTNNASDAMKAINK